MSSIIQTVGFADDQRRDIDVFYYTDGLFRRCTTATFQSLLYTEAFTSPLYNGEASIFFTVIYILQSWRIFTRSVY